MRKCRNWQTSKTKAVSYTHLDVYKRQLNECAGVFQYAQTCFEGLKAYTTEDGRIVCFRPDLNAQRLKDSCERLEMPVFPEDRFVKAVEEVVKANAAWVPPYGSGATPVSYTHLKLIQ